MTKMCFGVIGIALASATACTDPATGADGSDPGSPETVSSSDQSVFVGPQVPSESAAAALYATQCVLPSNSPAPSISVHPSGVVTWLLPGGTVMPRGAFCEIGKTLLYMQPDGNLVVYDENGQARWASNTFGSGDHTQFQPDGNLVVYNSANQPLRTGPVPSNTCCHSGYNLHVQADGNVVIYAPGWQPVWSTGTAH